MHLSQSSISGPPRGYTSKYTSHRTSYPIADVSQCCYTLISRNNRGLRHQTPTSTWLRVYSLGNVQPSSSMPSKQSSAASLTFTRASSSVCPCEIHPGTTGISATKQPSSPMVITTGNFITPTLASIIHSKERGKQPRKMEKPAPSTGLPALSSSTPQETTACASAPLQNNLALLEATRQPAGDALFYLTTTVKLKVCAAFSPPSHGWLYSMEIVLEPFSSASKVHTSLPGAPTMSVFSGATNAKRIPC